MHVSAISIVLMLALLILGCGDGTIGDSEKAEESQDASELLRADNPLGEVAAACAGLCRKQAEGAGCPAYVRDDSKCRRVCDETVSRFSAECAPKAEAYFNCGSRASWACRAGGNVPQLTSGSCASELQEYVKVCFGDE